MPRTRSAVAVTEEEPVEPVKSEEQVDLEDHEDEEEVEYEEVEEEVEEEEEEEVEEEFEEEEEENTTGTKASDDGMQVDEKDEDEIREHAELLALPPHGSEVYVGGIPRDASEEELKKFCQAVADVHEVRIVKEKDTKENKGYAFVSFKSKELASKAIEELNNSQFKGKKVRCSSSQSKHRLFIGNVPKDWVLDDLKKAVTKVGPGVTTVDLMKDPNNSSRNRAFAFIEYYNHACAEYSRKNMSSPKFKLGSIIPTVSWADPKAVDNSNTQQIKSIYVKNMPKDVTQDQLKKLFERHGDIAKIVLPPSKSGQEKRFGFVHYKERAAAMKALEDTEKYELNGDVFECSLAKPPAEKKVETGPSSQRAGLLPSYAPRGYGAMGGGYGALPHGYPPMMYGGAQLPAGMAMVPMVLPDGRLGYVLQQPGGPMAPPPPQRSAPHPHRSGNNRSGSSNNNRGRRNNDNNRGGGGRRFNPY